nr:hypothetical protein BgiMline_024569 [Biomphalaria glabrata]
MKQQTVLLTALVFTIMMIFCLQTVSCRSIDQIIADSSDANLHKEIVEDGSYLHEMDMMLTPEQRRMIFGDEADAETNQVQVDDQTL